jgi:MFS family permease
VALPLGSAMIAAPAQPWTVRHLPDEQQSLFTRAFVLLGVAELAYFTAAGVAIYALPLFVTGPIGGSKAAAGLAFGAFALTALVLRPFAGRLADVWGRRPLLLAGALLGAASLFATAWASNLLGVVAVRLLLGVGEAAFVVAAFAALVDIAPPARLGEALSYNSLALYSGLTLGPMLGQWVVGGAGLAAAWIAAGLLGVLALATAAAIGETRDPDAAAGPPGRLIHWPAVPVGLGFLASVVAMGGFLAFATLRAQDVGMVNTGLPLAGYGATVVLCRIAFAKVPDRVDPLALGAAALATIAAGITVAAAWASPFGLVLGAVVMGVGVAFSTPAFFTAIFATAPPAQRGAASGTASAFIDLGLGAGPLLLGGVAEAAGLPFAFAASGVIALVGMAWVLRLRTRAERRAPLGR